MPTVQVSTTGLISSFHGITKLNIGNYIAYLKSTGAANDNATALALQALQQGLIGLNSALQSGSISVNINTGGYHVIPVIGGVATPNLSTNLIQYVLLTENVTIAAPTGASGPLSWTLIMDQDSTGNWTASPDPNFYFINTALTGPANTRNQVIWVLDTAKLNSVSGAPSIAQPIPS